MSKKALMIFSVFNALCAIITVIWSSGSPAFATGGKKVIKASEFILVDGQGRERAGLGFEKGDPVFFLVGSNGKVASFWGVARDGSPMFLMEGADGNRKISLSINDNKFAKLLISTPNKPGALNVGINSTGDPYLLFNDQVNKRLMMLGIDGKRSSIGMGNSFQKWNVGIQDSKSASYLAFMNNNKNHIGISLGRTTNKNGLLLFDQRGNRMMVGMDASGLARAAIQQGGQIVWKAPADAAPDAEMMAPPEMQMPSMGDGR